MFQPVRGALKPELQTWSCAGNLIASRPWDYTGLVSMSWSSVEHLICVFETGVVRTFSVMCEKIHEFTIDERITLEGGAALAAHWSNGVAVLTRKFSLFVNHSVQRSGDTCYRCADLRVSKAPICLCILPPPHEESRDLHAIVGTTEGPVLLVDRHEAKELPLEDGPYIAFSVSNTGRLLACLSEKGVFKVLSIPEGLRTLDEANIECRKRPKQMVWCGDDCIALYFAVPTPSNTMQHLLFVGGPQDDWIPYHYDTPVHLVSECDGCRIVGAEKVEFVQRVPHSTEAIFSIGNCDPPAMLCYALERYEKGDVCAQESLRLIKEDLGDAVDTCVDAAQHEHDPAVFQSLLNAAVFGRHFLRSPPSPARFVDTCRNLRICQALRKPPIDMPLTVPQLDRLGMTGLITRLTQRQLHFLALRICDWVGHPRERVLFHWACEKIRNAGGSPCTDEQLCAAVMAKFQGVPVSGYADVARAAAETHRPHLATMLLRNEPRSSAQIKVLLQLSREGDNNAQIMLTLAMERAAQSHDPDLIHSALVAACGGDPTRRDADVQALVRLLKEKPQEFQVHADAFARGLQAGGQHERARTFYEHLGRSRQVAHSAVFQVFRKRDAEERSRWLRFAREDFDRCDASMPDAEKSSMQFCSAASSEEAELLKAQIALEEMSSAKRWQNGPHRFAGVPLIKTLSKLIEIGEVTEADNLRTKMKLSERRYWRIKVQALADAQNWHELNMMATHRTSPVGYELVVEAFLKHGQRTLAVPFVPKVKSLDLQATYYERLGMQEEARAARAQRQERAGPGKLLQNMLRFG